MASHIIVAAIMIMGIFSTSSARDFTVGWVQNPKESFNSFSSRLRFRVNDKLVFKYNKGEDSVLVVKKEDYDSCNVENPIQKLEGGDSSTFQLTRPGPFYFISGVAEKCSKGEKLALVVLSPKSTKLAPPHASMAPSISPTSSMAPSVSPSSSSMPPSVSPSSSLAPSVSPPTSSMVPNVSPSSTMVPSVSPSSSMAPSISSPPKMVPSISPMSSSSMAPSNSPSPAASMAPSISSPPSMVPSISPMSSPSSSMAPSNSPSPSVSGSRAPGSSIGGGNAPVASPTSTTQNAKSSATASSVTIIMGFLGVLGNAFLV